MMRATMLPLLALGANAACSQQQQQQWAQYMPDLVPQAPVDIQFKGDTMEWASHLTNMGHHFRYIGGMQQIVDGQGRLLCEEKTPIIVEQFRLYTNKGVQISQSKKEVSCLMDSYGGSANDALYKGAGCWEGVMGISAGGTDLYDSNTRDQRLNTRGWPEGRYFLTNELVMGNVMQLYKGNDFSYTIINLKIGQRGKSVDIIEECSGNMDCAAKLQQHFQGANQPVQQAPVQQAPVQQQQQQAPAPRQQQPPQQIARRQQQPPQQIARKVHAEGVVAYPGSAPMMRRRKRRAP